MSILGGEGNDRINISGARHALARAGSRAVPYGLYCPAATEYQKTNFSLDGGLGDDVITVDTTAAFSTIGGIATEVLGNDGFDRLHITGKLNDGIDEAERITAQMDADSVEVTIEALAELSFLGDIAGDALTLSFEKQFKIAALGIEAFTDALENKRTIRLEGEALSGEAFPFTNYEITELVTKYESYQEVPVLDDAGLPVLGPDGLPLTELVGVNPYEVLDFVSRIDDSGRWSVVHQYRIRCWR